MFSKEQSFFNYNILKYQIKTLTNKQTGVAQTRQCDACKPIGQNIGFLGKFASPTIILLVKAQQKSIQEWHKQRSVSFTFIH